jgi:hypothetical protein
MVRIGRALVTVGFSGALLVGCVGADQTTDEGIIQQAGHRCGVVDISAEEVQALEAKVEETHPDREEAKAPGSVKIKTYVHVINSGPTVANGNVSDEAIQRQIDVLNVGFAGKDGAGGFDTAYRFELVEVTRTTNAQWQRMAPDSAAERAAKTALRKGGPADLNLYIARPGGGLLGWAFFPQWYAEDPVMDGVVILDGSLPGGSAAPYDLGDTATHEVGHWLGLFHTFQGSCNPPGDAVKDTPRVRTPNFGCPVYKQVDSCPTPDNEGGPNVKRYDLVMNFMDYTDDGCMDSFTKKQAIRMDRYWDKFRAKGLLPEPGTPE